MKPANERKRITTWADIYPNMNRGILSFSASAPPNRITYPNKRIWVTVEIPGDLDLWPEIFQGENIQVVKTEIEG